MKSKIGAILLTAGASSRMGNPKALLPWGKGLLVEHMENVILDAGIEKIILVTGAHHSEIAAALPNHQNRICYNPGWRSGMGGSIGIGTNYLITQYPDLIGILILLIDQPRINSVYLNQMIDLFISGNGTIVASKYLEAKGAPALFGVPHFKRLQQLSKDKGAKSIIEEAGPDVLLINAGEFAQDMDTPEAYRELKKSLGK